MGQYAMSFQEKRLYTRMIIKGKVYAVISPNWIMPYQVIDISRSGLSFRYSGREILPDETLRLDLFDDSELCLQGVPAKIISDSPIRELSVPMRRCGLQFCELDENQLLQLQDFLAKHAVECPDPGEVAVSFLPGNR